MLLDFWRDFLELVFEILEGGILDMILWKLSFD